LFSACAPSEQDIQTAVAQTQAAMPTETPIPWSELQLDDLIIQPNDLPSGVSGSQISYYEECDASAGDICADYYISQELEFQGKRSGVVAVWVYGAMQDVLTRYDGVTDNFIAECKKTEGQCYPGDPKSIPELGDSSMMIDVGNWIGGDWYHIIFTRCNAAVYVELGLVSKDPSGVITYARRLDERLTSSVCR